MTGMHNQDQKLTALGRMAGGLTHEFNNLMAVIGGYAHILAAQFANDTAISAKVTPILNAVERGTALTARLIDFENDVPVADPYCDAVAVLNKNIVLLKPIFSSRIPVDLDLPEEEIQICCSEDILTQIVMAYGHQVRQAIPENGNATLRLTTTEDQAILMFSDTRSDAAPEADMNLLRQLATQCGANLGFRRSKKGFEMTLVLKRWNSFRDKTILVVDDEEAILPVLEGQLTAMGFRVLKAANADVALTMCQQDPGGIDCLLTDVMMPDVDGFQLAKRITADNPATRVVYMTGYSHLRDGRALQEPFPPDALVLPKPLLPEQLSYALSQALNTVQHMD